MMRGITSFSFFLPLVSAFPPGIPAPYSETPLGYNKLVFHDDFSSPTLGPAWTVNLGTSYPGGPPQWGTGEIQTYTSVPENLYLADDTLSIVPRNESGTWTSARIETGPEQDFACPENGKLLVRGKIKLGDAPAETQSGIWPAFWLLGSAYRGIYTNWPSVGEIDILESPNGERRTWHTTHCGQAEGGPCDEPNGIGRSVPFFRSNWNLLSLEIDRSSTPQRITWFINHIPTFIIVEDQVDDPEAWHALAAEPKMLLLNVAVGGGFPDGIAGRPTPDEATVGGETVGMQVDYVAVYTT